MARPARAHRRRAAAPHPAALPRELELLRRQVQAERGNLEEILSGGAHRQGHSGADRRFRTGRHHRADQHAFFLAACSTARKRILSKRLSIPDEPLESALRIAELRGVDVQVIVPKEGDSRLVTAASRTYCESMRKAGIKIFEYGPPMMHAKTMVVDETVAIVGTANLDNRKLPAQLQGGRGVLRSRHDRAPRQALRGHDPAPPPTPFRPSAARGWSPRSSSRWRGSLRRCSEVGGRRRTVRFRIRGHPRDCRRGRTPAIRRRSVLQDAHERVAESRCPRPPTAATWARSSRATLYAVAGHVRLGIGFPSQGGVGLQAQVLHLDLARDRGAEREGGSVAAFTRATWATKGEIDELRQVAVLDAVHHAHILVLGAPSPRRAR